MKKKDPTSHRIIEKRRRDRMNNCLADLSKLIPAHYMKKGRGRIEKTEIIEMAIKHLKDLIETTNAQQQIQHRMNAQTQSGATTNSTTTNNNITNGSANACYDDASTRIHTTENNTGSVGTANLNTSTNTSSPPDAIMAIDDLQQQFPNHHNETNDYLSHNSSSTSDKLNRSSPSSSSSGSESSISSSVSSISSRSSCGSTGCCSCGANLSSGSSSESGRYSVNTNHHTSGWYKKAWLVRSFLRSPDR